MIGNEKKINSERRKNKTFLPVCSGRRPRRRRPLLHFELIWIRVQIRQTKLGQMLLLLLAGKGEGHRLPRPFFRRRDVMEGDVGIGRSRREEKRRGAVTSPSSPPSPPLQLCSWSAEGEPTLKLELEGGTRPRGSLGIRMR